MKTLEPKQKYYHIHPEDNICVSLVPLEAEEILQIAPKHYIKISQAIPQGHKIAIQSIPQGSAVYKYGQIIGRASKNIAAGEHVHSHNLSTQLSGSGTVSYQYDQQANCKITERWEAIRQQYSQWPSPSFNGYKRSQEHPSCGATGIRNEIWVLPMVQCVNSPAQRIINEYLRQNSLPANIDGIYSFPHPYGCSQLGDDLANTRRILQAMCEHPNAAGILLLGLGCESNTFELFSPELLNNTEGRIRTLRAQECENEIATGVELICELIHIAQHDKRSERPFSELSIGLKCGGSDGFSGLTANPLVGHFSDFLIAQGGTAVLSEVPEMFGAEQLLMNRASKPQVFSDIVHLIDSFKAYFERYGQPVFENPTPGNKQGGITTLEDKSLGCIQKSGNSLVQGVHAYGTHITGKKGLHLLSTPGNDGVSTSALAAAGCDMILFTTGRGTPLGSFVPTLKISSNSQLAKQKKNWIDFDAGCLLEQPQEKILQNLIHCIQTVASGQQAKNEESGFRELTIFKDGITM